jgi:excinuclease UvrABC ATPase subunit
MSWCLVGSEMCIRDRGGDGGGTVLVEGPPEKVAECAESYTGKYLKTMLK